MNRETEFFLNILKKIYIPFLSIKDMKAIYILNIINKNCEITEYKNKYLDTSNDIFLQSTVRETMFFKGKFYRLSFKYKNIEMLIYKEDNNNKITLYCYENERVFKEDLDFIREFIFREDDYTKEDLLEIKKRLLKSFDDKVKEAIQYREIFKEKKEKEEKLKKLLYELMEE